MDKTTIIKKCSILALLVLFFLPSVVHGYHVGVTWGPTYHPTQYDPDPYWFATYEEPEHRDACQYITNLIWSGQAGSNWVGNNFYGSCTTASYVYQCSDLVQGNPNYDFLATFHVGDMYPNMVSGGYWQFVGYEWGVVEYYYDPNLGEWVEVWGWVPIWEWIYTGPTRHYAYYGSQGASNGIEDSSLYSHTGGKHRFTFIYTCSNGNLIDIDGDGAYNFYGFVDTQNGTGIVGMPFAWTRRTDLSWNGYADPDNSGYAYIGFENISKWMCDSSEFYTQNYADFVEHFYDYALDDHMSVSDALDRAMLDMTNNAQNFGQSVVYNGYDAYDPASQRTWRSRMRVFGDGNMVFPS